MLVRKLVREISEDSRDENPVTVVPGLTRTEARFFARAVARGATVLRSGWPDFLIVENGRAVGVEVKRSRADPLSPNQAVMFDALEKIGVRVFVWSNETGDRLVGWRKWSVAFGEKRFWRRRGMQTQKPGTA